MEYELFIELGVSIIDLVGLLNGYTESHFNSEVIKCNNGNMSIICNEMAMDIEAEKYEDIDFIKNLYKINVNHRIGIRLINSEFETGFNKIFKIVNYLIKNNVQKLLLLHNGSVQVCRLDNGSIIFNSNMSHIPLSEFEIPYSFERLEVM